MRSEFVLLAIVGAVLMTAAIWLQMSSIDLNAHSMSEYLLGSISLWPWWVVVGLPCLLGAMFVAISIVGLTGRLESKHAAIAILVAMVLALAFSFMTPWGYAPFVASLVALYISWQRSKRNSVAR